jgi:archaellum biogenesis ATPase FlaH
MEHKIIAAVITNRESFDRIDQHLGQEDISPEGMIVLKAIREFYYRDASATAVDMEVLSNTVLRKLQNPKHADIFKLYLDKVSEQDVSSVNIVADVLAAKTEVIKMALAESILARNNQRSEELRERWTELRLDDDLEGSVHEEYQGIDADELLEAFDEDHLIKVAPSSLNRRLGGGVLTGHHLVIVAYPETGKTMLSLVIARAVVQQGHKVLYIGNEDPIKSIVRRFVSCLSGMDSQAIAQAPEVAIQRARRVGYDRAVFAGVTGGTLEDIRALIIKHEPKVLIVDQIRNITSKAENRTLQLEQVARAMRNFAREFELVAISITQGADSARGKNTLDMGDVDGSNVGIPGTADAMIMIGMSADFEENGMRQLTLAKNKIGGLHQSWPVNVQPELSRISNVG